MGVKYLTINCDSKTRVADSTVSGFSFPLRKAQLPYCFPVEAGSLFSTGAVARALSLSDQTKSFKSRRSCNYNQGSYLQEMKYKLKTLTLCHLEYLEILPV